MSQARIRCGCGQVSVMPEFVVASGFRCPHCGALLQSDRPGRAAAAAASGGADPDDDETPYHLEADKPAARSSRPPPAQGTWVPMRTTVSAALATSTTRTGPVSRTRSQVALPGPFFRWTALAYPLRHPTWLRWLGLSFMTVLAVGVVAITVFTSWVIVTMGAFLSVLAIGSMAVVCLALVSYVVANFVGVIEDTASGDDHLGQLVDLNWWDILPRFMQVLGAAVVTMTIVYMLTAPLTRWFPSDNPGLIFVRALIAYQLFPVFLFANLAEGSWVPFWSLLITLRRLASSVGMYALFLLITGPAALAVVFGLAQLFRWHVAAAVAGSGPVLAAWLMFYGHWLGRLGRQLEAAAD